jgi:hypothetical protein
MGALNQENKITPDAFKKSGKNFPVTKPLNIYFSKLTAVAFTNLFGQVL